MYSAVYSAVYTVQYTVQLYSTVIQFSVQSTIECVRGRCDDDAATVLLYYCVNSKLGSPTVVKLLLTQ